MELILTSFGLSHLHRNPNSTDIFYRMPPVSLSEITGQAFTPDYAILLLCDRIVLDVQTYNKLISGEFHYGYQQVAEVIKALFDEGFVRIEDFDSIVEANRELLDRMLNHDLKYVERWIKPLQESAQTWQDFVVSMRKMREVVYEDYVQGRVGDINQVDDEQKELYYHTAANLHDIMSQTSSIRMKYILFEEAIKSSNKRRKSEYKRVLQDELAEYLAYVNANLVVSNTLGVGFHDWCDFAPFYREKFLAVGHEQSPEQREIEKINQLFRISFPELTFWDTKSILKALKDKRIQDLRILVDEAIKHEVSFDREFANRVLREVLYTERKISRIRNIVSYITLPIDFIPWVGTVAQKGTEELVSRLAERKFKKEYRWFYLISELSEHAQPLSEEN